MTRYHYIRVPRNHPLLTRYTDDLGEHRVVLFDKLGFGSHPCHWCDRLVAWHPVPGELRLVTDHLDDDSRNNDSVNLVASCIRCNSWRVRHPLSFDRFIAERTQAAS